MFNPERGRSESDSTPKESEGGEREPTPNEEIIESKFGKEMLEEIAQNSDVITRALSARIAEIGSGEGSLSEQRELIRKHLDTWGDFSKNLFMGVSSGDKMSIQKVETAIGGASAALSIESTPEGEESAINIVRELSEKYGYDWIVDSKTGDELKDRYINNYSLFMDSSDPHQDGMIDVIGIGSMSKDTTEAKKYLEENRKDLSPRAIRVLELLIELSESKIQE